MKKLGFGLMRLPVNDPTNPADVDIERGYARGHGAEGLDDQFHEL